MILESRPTRFRPNRCAKALRTTLAGCARLLSLALNPIAPAGSPSSPTANARAVLVPLSGT